MTDVPAATAPVGHVAIEADLFCPGCGYNLRGLTGDRCPECGDSIEGLRDPVSKIPWVHRKQIGWWKGYWKTVYLVMFKTQKLAAEVSRPVSYPDARRFRAVTVAIAALSIVGFDLVLWYSNVGSPFSDPLLTAIWDSVVASVVFDIASVLFLLGATNVPGLFLRPRTVPEIQARRAYSLGLYTCAPLALLPIPVLFTLPSLFLEPWSTLVLLRPVLGPALALSLFGLLWSTPVQLARRVLPQRQDIGWRLTVGLPVLWIACSYLVLVSLAVFLGALIFVYVVVATLA